MMAKLVLVTSLFYLVASSMQDDGNRSASTTSDHVVSLTTISNPKEISSVVNRSGNICTQGRPDNTTANTTLDLEAIFSDFDICDTDKNGEQSSDLEELDNKLKQIIFYIQPFVYFGGLLMNILGCHVFLFKMKGDYHDFTVCLLIVNSCWILTRMINFIFKDIPYYNLDTGIADVFCWIVLVNGIFLEFATKSLTYCQYAILSANSFFAVAYPLRFQQIVFVKHPKRTTLSCLLFYITVFSFNLFRFRVSFTVNPSTGQTTFVYRYTDFAIENGDLMNIYGFVGIAVTYFIPLPVTVIFFISTLVSLKRSAKSVVLSMSEKHRSTKIAQTKRLAKIFMTVSLLQIICTFPRMVYLILAKFDDEYKIGGSKYYIQSIISSLFGTLNEINHGAASLVYIAMSKSVRQEFRKIYCRQQEKQDPSKT